MYKTQRPPKSQYMVAFFTHIENKKKDIFFKKKWAEVRAFHGLRRSIRCQNVGAK